MVRTTLDKDIVIEIIDGREMTEPEVESVAYLLFTWWRREFEEKNYNDESPKDISAFD